MTGPLLKSGSIFAVAAWVEEKVVQALTPAGHSEAW